MTWQETTSSPVPGKSQIFVERSLGPGMTNCWQEAGVPGVGPSAADPSLDVDPTREGIEPDIAFAGEGDAVPWVVWYEISLTGTPAPPSSPPSRWCSPPGPSPTDPRTGVLPGKQSATNSGEPPGATTASAKVAKAKVSGTQVSVGVSCPGTDTGGCRLELKLIVTRRSHGNRRAASSGRSVKTTVVGSASLALKAGQVKIAQVP